MKKLFVISLSLFIVILSFSFCFASNEPVILPIGDGSTATGYAVPMQNGSTNYYTANVSPVYLVNYYNTSSGNMARLMFSDVEGAIVNTNNPSGIQHTSLTYVYNGYYYASSTLAVPDTSYGDFASPQDVIDDIQNSVFNTTFDLTYLVNGSISWLSTFARAVKNNALLLFFVVFIFVGIGIGLLNRFRRG